METEMDTFTATMICEGNPEAAGLDPDELTQADLIDAWQHLIDTGLCWQLQGSFGRGATAMIEAGYCEARS